MLLKTTKYDNTYSGCFRTLGNMIYRNVYLKSFPTSQLFYKTVKLLFRSTLFL